MPKERRDLKKAQNAFKIEYGCEVILFMGIGLHRTLGDLVLEQLYLCSS